MNIREFCKQAYDIAHSKGWHSIPATFGDRLALCHSELSEALEAFREHDNEAFNAFEKLYKSKTSGLPTRSRMEFVMVRGEDGEMKEEVQLNKPEGVWSELADTVIRIAHMCHIYGIDLEDAIEQKMAFNRTRPYLHGGKKL